MCVNTSSSKAEIDEPFDSLYSVAEDWQGSAQIVMLDIFYPKTEIDPLNKKTTLLAMRWKILKMDLKNVYTLNAAQVKKEVRPREQIKMLAQHSGLFLKI